ncbi:MAG: hypothetical protein ACR2MM_03415 [Flavobacteriaceae bacterium]
MIKNKFLIAFLVAAVLFASCSSDDKLVDEIFATVERGAILRTITNDPNSFVFNDPASVWAVTWEAQDEADGELFRDVEVYVDFIDNTPSDGTIETDEVLLATVGISEFEGGVWGLPRVDYEVTYQEALDALGLPFSTAYASDQINFRQVINLTDGRSWTNTDLAGTVSGGSFFASPLNYRANIVCPPKAGTVGTWTVDMQDSYGDGWNGATLDVSIDGTTTSFLITQAQGSSNSETFEITGANTELSIIYRSGDWDSEVTFQVTNPNSTVILDVGPSPTADTEFLDYCSDF